MGIGNNRTTDQKKIYLSIKEGKVRMSQDNGTPKLYDYIEGRITAIYQRVNTFSGKDVTRWVIELTDDDEGLIYAIVFGYNSGVFKSIILSLWSDEQLTTSTPIRIEAYRKNNLDKVVVYSDGIKLEWGECAKEMPRAEEILFNGQIVKDTYKQMSYISDKVKQLRTRLRV